MPSEINICFFTVEIFVCEKFYKIKFKIYIDISSPTLKIMHTPHTKIASTATKRQLWDGCLKETKIEFIPKMNGKKLYNKIK